MTDYLLPDDDSDDVSYEDFDDIVWDDPDALEAIDLDALDDKLPDIVDPGSDSLALDQATSDLLDSLEGNILPDQKDNAHNAPGVLAAPTQPGTIPANDLERVLDSLDEDAPVDTAETIRDGIGDEPTTEDLVYQVLIGLPPELGAQVLELRETGAISDMPPPGIVLTPRFRAKNREALTAALNAWVRRHLPLQLEVTSVQAEVIGSQRYVAAWRVGPEAALYDILGNLKRALVGLIQPVPNAPAAVHVRVTIGDGISAVRYPRVIAQMQRDFEPYSWHARSVLLAAYNAQAAEPTWDIIATLDSPTQPPDD